MDESEKKVDWTFRISLLLLLVTFCAIIFIGTYSHLSNRRGFRETRIEFGDSMGGLSDADGILEKLEGDLTTTVRTLNDVRGSIRATGDVNDSLLTEFDRIIDLLSRYERAQFLLMNELSEESSKVVKYKRWIYALSGCLFVALLSSFLH